MLDAVKRVLLRETRAQPVLVIFEDLHWIDGETQAVLDGLVESLGSTRTLLMVNYRPEYSHTWSGKTYYSHLRLDALAAESASALLEAVLGDDPGLEPLKRLLVKRGNPFFLEETVQTLVETRALAGERGRYRLTQPVPAIHVAPTVQAVLAARIDRLRPEDKRLLQVASVVGKGVPLALLEQVAEVEGDALRGSLDRLQAAEFLYEIGLTRHGASARSRSSTARPSRDSRLMRGTCSGTSRPDRRDSTRSAARPTTARRWRWRSHAACARSSPTATSVSVGSTSAWTSARTAASA
jgi:predicted ATPase